jgi:hypothetical protein
MDTQSRESTQVSTKLRRQLVGIAVVCSLITIIAAVGVVRSITGRDEPALGVFAAIALLGAATLTYAFTRAAIRVYRDPNLRVPTGPLPRGFGESSRPIRAAILIVCGVVIVLSSVLMHADATSTAALLAFNGLIIAFGLLLTLRHRRH